MNDYIKIDWLDVRKGDVLMHENGDRLTVQGFESVQVRTTAGLYAPSEYEGSGFTPHRKVEPLPTTPGAYYDKDGILCVLMPRFAGDRYSWMIAPEGTMTYWTTGSGEDIVERGPFTRLVPMPTEESVNSSIFKGFSGGQVSGVYIERATDAVMALLGGETSE